MELDDSDYGIVPYSALGSITNTVDYSGVWFYFFVEADYGSYYKAVQPDSDGNIKVTITDGGRILWYTINVTKSLPPIGVRRHILVSTNSTFPYPSNQKQQQNRISNANFCHCFFMLSYQVND